ncbi:MAG: hypothetical protein AB1351_12240 [Thermoproteota archaeon]
MAAVAVVVIIAEIGAMPLHMCTDQEERGARSSEQAQASKADIQAKAEERTERQGWIK